jgi:hypothetical protein
VNLIPGFEGPDDPPCRQDGCEYEPKPHGRSHLPVTFVLVVSGPGYAAQFRVGASYLDSEALGNVFADLHAHVWRDWCRLTRARAA